MGKSKTKVVYCVTSNYIEKILPSVRSLREYNDCDIYLVTETDRKIEDFHVIDIRKQSYFKPNSVNYNNHFTYIGLLKVCYQTLLPLDRVIHLDADTIITDNLDEMWNTDLTNKWYAMTPEYKGRYHPFGAEYYNAGVMVINLKQLRTDNIQDKMVDYLNTVKQPWCEQDAFNKYGIEQDKIVPLDIRYNENVMTGYTDSPAITHYCSIGNWWTNKNMFRWELLDRYKDCE